MGRGDVEGKNEDNAIERSIDVDDVDEVDMEV